MYIYKLPRQHMSQDGKAILRSIQNDSLPWIDLVIRESFQNSLDATRKDKSESIIEVTIGEFETTKVAHHFDKIDKTLIERFGDSVQTVLAIQDKNTTGLEGEVGTDDEEQLYRSKFYKLVYGLSMHQEEQGAGGSWGLGKTSFFRIGVGIVAYYTRVQLPNGDFQERLAASLIEDPKSENRILDSALGIAWWGDTDNLKDDYSNTRPIVDSEQIHQFLSDFGIKLYSGEETGTTIIIPFLDKEKLLLDANDENEESEKVYWWETDLEESIKLAIQRWYLPRILNQHYTEVLGNANLRAIVNGEVLSPTNFQTPFRWFYHLYTSALCGTTDYPKSITAKPITNLRTVLKNSKQPVGRVAFAQLSFEELGIVGENKDLNPLAYLGMKDIQDESDKGRGILAYCRKPGMIIEYVTEASTWLKSVPLKDDHFLFAFFVPDSNAIMHEKYKEQYPNLESYLRDTENADHAQWVDKTFGANKLSIVTRIQRYVGNTLKDAYKEDDGSETSSKTSVLSRKYGGLLLPPNNFGKSGNSRRETPPAPNPDSLKNRISSIRVDQVRHVTESELEVKFTAFLHKFGKSLIRFDVVTSDSRLDEIAWNKKMEGAIQYPFNIKGFAIDTINDMIYDQEGEEESKIKFFLHPENHKSTIMIDTEMKNADVKGSITLDIADSMIQPELVIRAAKEKKGEDE